MAKTGTILEKRSKEINIKNDTKCVCCGSGSVYPIISLENGFRCRICGKTYFKDDTPNSSEEILKFKEKLKCPVCKCMSHCIVGIGQRCGRCGFIFKIE